MSHFNDYKPFIEEIHHTKKLDAPSGTAITLATGIIKSASGISMDGVLRMIRLIKKFL